MGPQGCLYLRHIHSPASQSLDAGCPLKGTRLWEKQLPLADMDFQRATHLRAFSRKLLWQMPGAGGGVSGSTVSTGAHLSSMSGAMFAIVFRPQRNGLALNGSYSGQLAFCWWFQQELFQWSVGRREESR